MRWVHPVSAELAGDRAELGGKALGLALLHRLGLRVPPAFVVSAEACRVFLSKKRLPDGLREELAEGIAGLERATGRVFGGPGRPLAVSVRSGAGVSMPGMMDTVLGLGLTAAATAGLAAETGDEGFARDSRARFLASFAAATPVPVPDDAPTQLALAVEAVLASWHSPRAHTYRTLHTIPHDLGTAVIVQAMVFGNRDPRSGTGVAFSRDPNTGENTPYGDVLFRAQGEDVVSGAHPTRPLRELADREPALWAELLDALRRVEGHYRDACYTEFTFQSGELWLLQVRPGRFTNAAAVRTAVELAEAGAIDRHEALRRVRSLAHVRTPRIAEPKDVVARGVGACPGVAVGRVATTTEAAVRMARDSPVVLFRPETSPNDLRGIAAAAGIVTERGGPASHAAVVARALNKPAVVGAQGSALPEGTLITIDGTTGEVALGTPRILTGAPDHHVHRLLAWADDLSGNHTPRADVQRLEDAHRTLGVL
ncbi:pyruvate, phosphate dikinase [Streptomyces acidiscabies]|uniref:pyruvate, phosphate dikinase n=1 Tax=Streptomyces acidiscabies TaxID=42234 RepID=UPI0030CE7DBB